MLLIDDVQFLQGKARTADEFFHTFNALHEGGAQIVLTADRMPAELSALAERLRERFEWGLTVALEPPDLTTRLVFLGNLVREQSESRSRPRRCARSPPGRSSNLRLLEGALTRVVALSSLTASAVTPDVRRPGPARRHSRSTIRPHARVLGQIQEAVADQLGVSRDEHPLPQPHRSRRQGPPARHVPDPRAHRPLPSRDRAAPSTAATTPPSCTPSAGSERSALEDAASLAHARGAHLRAPFEIDQYGPGRIVTERIERIEPRGRPHIHTIHSPYYS